MLPRLKTPLVIRACLLASLLRASQLFTERGEGLPGFTQVDYFNFRAHERNGLWECPLKNGSGLETDLTPGKKYRLFLDNLDKKEILFSELLE